MSESKEKKESETPKCRLNAVCVFGESDFGKTGEFLSASSELGSALAARKINFVYGGGVRSLRGNAAVLACSKGSKILSVTVKELQGQFFTFGDVLSVSSLPERMGCMFYIAQAFIALPGGLETLDGISSIAYWAKLNFHKKPLGLLNVNGFYDSLLMFLDLAVEKGFITQATRNTIMAAPTADQLIDQLQAYASQPSPLVKLVVGQSSRGSRKQSPDTTLHL